MKKKLFGKISIVQRISGVIKPRRKLTGVLNATRARTSLAGGIMSGHFVPTFCGAFGTAGTPVSYYTLVDVDGFTLIDKDGCILMTKEGDDTLWQTQ